MRAFACAAVRAAASVARAGPRARPLPSRAVASAASSASPPSPDDVRTATLRWVDDRVIGYNLCPFAKAPRANDGLKLVVCEHDSTDAFFETFASEVDLLCETYTDADEAYDDEEGDETDAAAEGNNDDKDPAAAPRWRDPALSEPSTTLIAVPYVRALADDFVLFLAVAERCEEILEDKGVTDKVQLATFHPEYQFAGEEVGDPGSYTNRSPYPTVHLLRSVDVSRAVDAHPDTESIPETNIERLRAVGREKLLEGLREFAAWRGG